MKIVTKYVEVQSEARVTFDNITPQVQDIVQEASIKEGQVVVYSPHTTCSVSIQEYSDGQTFYGTELIMQDLVNVLTKLIPTCTNESQYLHPNINHVTIAAEERNELPCWSLNTDAHLRSVIMGRSVTIPVLDGKLCLGEFGRIWFGDWDQVRARTRKAIVQVIGD